MGSQRFELCTITWLLWQSDDVRMHETTQISELMIRFVHRKLTRMGGYLGTRQTPMKSQGILLEGAILIERFLQNPYSNAPQDCGCPEKQLLSIAVRRADSGEIGALDLSTYR